MNKEQWCDFEVSDDGVLALYSKSKKLQWDGAHAIDWSRPIDPSAPVHADVFPLLKLPIFQRLSEAQRAELTVKFLRGTLSLFLHGEQGALIVAAELVKVAPDYEAKLYAATQTMDEARHVEIFARYLERTGGIDPYDPRLRSYVGMLLGADSWLKMMIGMQIVVEGTALHAFHAYRRRANDPVLCELLDGVVRDEARHVGFGTLYIRTKVEQLGPDEREELADFVFDAIFAYAETQWSSLTKNVATLASVGITPDDVLKDAAAWLKTGKGQRDDTTRDGFTQFVLPTLRRLGVLTPRIEQKFIEARLAPSSTSPLLEQLDALVQAQQEEGI